MEVGLSREIVGGRWREGGKERERDKGRDERK